MPKLIGDSGASRVPVHQADAAISQANPNTTQLYDVLPTPFTWTNVRLISIASAITWAVDQPTPLEVVVTIDGNTVIYGVVNPVSDTVYVAVPEVYQAAALQTLIALSAAISQENRNFLLEGRSVRVQIRITFAAGAPTPLACRVKWARFP